MSSRGSNQGSPSAMGAGPLSSPRVARPIGWTAPITTSQTVRADSTIAIESFRKDFLPSFAVPRT